jgi:hypothetical protein
MGFAVRSTHPADPSCETYEPDPSGPLHGVLITIQTIMSQALRMACDGMVATKQANSKAAKCVTVGVMVREGAGCRQKDH